MSDVEVSASSAKVRKVAPFKRLVFCFDGTWNKLTADTPTNVVLTAASIERLTSKGVTQIIHYDEGVGTGQREKYTGGIFGAGLDVNLREAYRFLLFNYDPSDEIFVFGFSRGAFTARTFVGLLRHVGPLRRLHVDRIDEAIALYKARNASIQKRDDLQRFKARYADSVCTVAADDAWRCANIEGYEAGSAPFLKIKFLGVWDTVAAMGVPAVFPGNRWLNRKHHYHDTSVDGFVEFARHAVAIDERRATFPATLAEGFDALNRSRDFKPEDPKAPYQERWFPGVHGSVGGGGDIRGLSDASLAWVLEGAKQAGLRLDTSRGTRIHGFAPDATAPLLNITGGKPGFMDLLQADRPGPTHAWQVHRSAQRRWQKAASDGAIYRPTTLALAKAELDAIPANDFVAPTDVADIVLVERNDNLFNIAKRVWDNGNLFPLIFDANRDTLDDPNIVFEGQRLRIPQRPRVIDQQDETGAAA